MVKIEILKKVAFRIGIFGGIATFAAINTVPFILSNQIKNTEEYKQAMQLLNSHPEAIKHLGEPITSGHINVTKQDNFGGDNQKFWFKVPVSGPKGKGRLSYQILKSENEKDMPKLSTVELFVNNIEGYKLIIKRE